MPRPRIYTTQSLAPEKEVELETGQSRHLVRVLRLKPGAEILLFNGDGFDYLARLSDTGDRTARALIVSKGESERPPRLVIHLGIGISKSDRMDVVIQKSIELGVERISPLFCSRSVFRLKGERLEKKLIHWKNVAIAACEQSGRRRIPEICTPKPLHAWMENVAKSPGTRLLLSPGARRSLADLPHPENVLTLLIGPEGGFAENEIQLSRGMGFLGIKLGPRVLRTETAPLATIAAIQTLWGDFR